MFVNLARWGLFCHFTPLPRTILWYWLPAHVYCFTENQGKFRHMQFIPELVKTNPEPNAQKTTGIIALNPWFAGTQG
jgi:hypothetical protein